jgi:hypothetical protein
MFKKFCTYSLNLPSLDCLRFTAFESQTHPLTLQG